jgi:palmitoyltransferase
MPRKVRRFGLDDEEDESVTDRLNVEAFRKRQEEDFQRQEHASTIKRRQPFRNRYDETAIATNDTSSPSLYVEDDGEGEESWRDDEGQRLKDFGLDEEAEFYDQETDEDMPLAELLRKKQGKKS